MAQSTAVAPPTQPAQNIQQANKAAEKLIVQNAVEMTQSIYSGTVYPQQSPVLNIQPRNVGIIKRFIVKVQAQIQNTSATNTLAPADFFLSNILSQVVFYDLQNNLRINTTGMHLTALSSVKRRRMFTSMVTLNATGTTIPSGIANDNVQSMYYYGNPIPLPVVYGDLTIAPNTTQWCQAWYEIPLSYSDDDLRGAVFANVVNTSMNLQLTFNANPCVDTTTAPTTDDTFAVYRGATGTMAQANVTVYQVYLDQLPTTAQGQFILPQISLGTVYELKNTTFRSMTSGADYPFPFTNFRDFLSTFVLYNTTGQSGGRVSVSDVNYFSLTTANYTNIFKVDNQYIQLLTREIMHSDFPQGLYYFSFRKRPIWTTQFGNQQLNLNPSSAGYPPTANAYAQVMWEDLVLQNTLVGGASLSAT